jgi:alanine racemase
MRRRVIAAVSESAADPAADPAAAPSRWRAPARSAPAIRPTRVEVDLGALLHNVRAVHAVAGAPVVAVVKADGYGHGATPVAVALDASEEPGLGGLAVSLVEEGVQLREAGVRLPIWVLGPALHGGHDELVARDLTPIVSDAGDLEELAAVARRRGRPVEAHLKVDTGMGRLGLLPQEVGEVVAGCVRDGAVAITGLATHFACADVDDPADRSCATYAQLDAFDAAERVARAAGAPLRLRHVANSSGAMAFPRARLDRVRCGLALYGNGRWAVDATLPAPRRQVMRLVTEVAQVRLVAAGTSVGYGGLWRAPVDTPVAVLPLGYADGLPRRATGHAQVLIGGVRCPLVGAVSMDIVIADVRRLPRPVRPGDEVVLLGAQGDEEITVAEFAGWAGLSAYEVTCGISKRVPRVYR